MKKLLLPLLVGLLAFGAVTFIGWMGGYNFTRDAQGFTWASFAMIAFVAGIAFTVLGIKAEESEKSP